MDDSEYRRQRSGFLNDPRAKSLLPQFIRKNVDSDGVWAYLKDHHTGGGAYAARRKHINEEFHPLLDYLMDSGAPADAGVSETLSQYDGPGVEEAWHKALERRETDPEGAITAARTLLEEVCKHILDDAGETYEGKWDLPKLYSNTAKQMNLAPSQHTEETFKRILGGCQSIVENLGGLRNKISDAHGGGRLKVKPTKRHAALAVNLAGSMAMFLIETWANKQMKAKREQARDETPVSKITYKGAILSSRHSIKAEIEEMARIMDVMTRDASRRLEFIWCDSKAGATYTVTVRDGLWIPDLQLAIADAVEEACGGHNGIYIDGDAPSGHDIEPFWPDGT